MRALALLNCGLCLFSISSFQLSYQQRDHPFALALLGVMVVFLIISLLNLRDERRFPLWVTLPYSLFVLGIGLMNLPGYSGLEPYWYTLAIFVIGGVCAAAGMLLAVTERRSKSKAGSSTRTG